MKFQFAFFFLLVLSAWGQLCKPSSGIIDLWTGITSFILPDVANNTMAYNFDSYTLPTPRAYDSKSNLQYCFALKELAVSTGNIQYMDLLVLKTYQSSIVINFIYQPNKWSKVEFNYWIGFRRDILMGIESFTDKQFKRDGPKGIVESRVELSNVKSEQAVVMVFLVGVRYKYQNNAQHHLSFTLTAQFLNKTTLNVHFSQNSPLFIESVTISYLIYSPEAASFASYGGIISESSLKGLNNRNLYYLIPNYNFKSIFGLSAIEATVQKQNGFTYQSSLSEYYSFVYGVKQWEMLAKAEISYVVIGILPGQLCSSVSACQYEQKLFIYEQECVKECPARTKKVSYIDGGVECRGCPTNQQYEANTDSCECDSGYTRKNTGECQKINPIVTTPVYSRADSGDSLDGSGGFLQDCLKMAAIQQSNNNVFVTLQASVAVLQDNKSTESGFIKIKFPDTSVPISYYCNPCPKDPSLYECLLLFATGLPSTLFTMTFSTSDIQTSQGSKQCRLSVPYKSIKS